MSTFTLENPFSVVDPTATTSPTTGAITTSGGLGVAQDASVGGKVSFFGSSSGFTALRAPSAANNITLILPGSLPLVNPSYLISDTAGNLSFTEQGGGGGGGGTAAFTTFTFLGNNNQSTPANVTGMVYTTGSFEINVSVDIIATNKLTQFFKLSGILSGTSGWNLLTLGETGDVSGVLFAITPSGQIQYTSANYPGFTSLTISWSDYLPVGTNINLVSGANTSGAIPQSAGTLFSVNGSTVLDTDTAASGTLGVYSSSYMGVSTLTALNTNVKTTTGNTLYIAGPPVSGTNETILNPYSLNVATGNMYMGGEIRFFGAANAYTALKGSSAAGNISLTLPETLPTTPGSFIVSDTSGKLTFSTSITPSLTSFSGANNQIVPISVPGMSFTSGLFEINVSVNVIATTNLTQFFKLSGILSTTSGWNLLTIGQTGDTSGVTFTITSTGQIQYTSASYPGFVSLTISWSNYTSVGAIANVSSGTNTSGTISTTSGTLFTVNGATVIDTDTAASGTLSNFNSAYIGIPNLSASNTNVTTTTANTLYIAGPPAASTNETITNGYSLNVASGNMYLGGTLRFFGANAKYIGLKAPSAPTNNATFTLPLDVPSVTGSYIIVDTSGNLSYTQGVSAVTRNFTGTNNQSAPTNITGMVYTSGSFEVNINVNITATSNLNALCKLSGILSNSSGWNLTSTKVSGDDTGITFSITGTGQVQYTSSNYSGFVSLIFNWVDYAPTGSATNLVSGVNVSGTVPVSSGSLFTVNGATVTDATTASSGTLSNFNSSYIGISTLTATNTGVTTTTANTLYIAGAPSTGTNETITNKYALNVASGTTLLGGILNISNTTQLGTTSQTVSPTSGALTVQGDIHLYNATKNAIIFNSSGSGPPTFTNRSAGTKLVLYPGIASNTTDISIGVDNGDMWYGATSAAWGHRFYSGTTVNAYIGNGTVNIPTTTQLATASNVVSSATGALTVQGDVHLYNGTKNTIVFNTVGLGAPTLTNRSVGSKIVLWPTISGTIADYAIGTEANATWYSVPNSGATHKFYCGTTLNAQIANAYTAVYGAFTVNYSGLSPSVPIIKISPTTNGTESSIGFYQNTGESGASWIIGHNTGAVGSNNFGIYSSTYGSVMNFYNTGAVNIPSTVQLAANSQVVNATSGALTVQGDIHLYNGTKNTIVFNTTGSAAPTFTNRSTGTKIVLWPAIGAGGSDHAIGIETNANWYGVPTSAQFHRWYAGITNVMELSGTGNLSVIGDITAFGSVSDERLKVDVRGIDIENSLDIVTKLRPVAFKWKSDIFNEEKRGKEDIGFIAQEISELIPEAVGDYRNLNDNDIVYKCLKYERIIPHLVGAIQNLNKELTKLHSVIEKMSAV